MTENTHLELAQIAFTEWLTELDRILETAQLKHEEAIGAARNGDVKAFGEAIGITMGHVDMARAEIKAGLNRGF